MAEYEDRKKERGIVELLNLAPQLSSSADARSGKQIESISSIPYRNGNKGIQINIDEDTYVPSMLISHPNTNNNKHYTTLHPQQQQPVQEPNTETVTHTQDTARHARYTATPCLLSMIRGNKKILPMIQQLPQLHEDRSFSPYSPVSFASLLSIQLWYY